MGVVPVAWFLLRFAGRPSTTRVLCSAASAKTKTPPFLGSQKYRIEAYMKLLVCGFPSCLANVGHCPAARNQLLCEGRMTSEEDSSKDILCYGFNQVRLACLVYLLFVKLVFFLF